MATYHLKYPPWQGAVMWMRLQWVWCNIQPLQLVHWAVMKLVYEAQECTWMEVKLRASPRLHHEVCRGCAIILDELYSRNDGKQRARWCKKGNKWTASAWFHVEDETGRGGRGVMLLKACDVYVGQGGCVEARDSAAVWLHSRQTCWCGVQKRHSNSSSVRCLPDQPYDI